MADDIVTRLRINADQIEWEQPLAADRHRAAADEIERLRAAGDALAAQMGLLIYEHMLLKNVLHGDVRIAAERLRAVEAWEEARRG